MKKIMTPEYQCEICKEVYESKNEALMCESRPISEDKGVKVGDIILITGGQGIGYKGKVTRRFIYDKNWGHYQHQLFWHTVGLEADVIDSWGSRQLTFQDYVVIKE